MNKVKITSLQYSPQLDGLRAICILFTLFNHIEGVPTFINGRVGVFVFFPLSGFLITSILLDGCTLKSYLTKRFFRIAPLYYLAFFSTIAAAFIGAKFGIGGDRLTQVEYMFFPSLFFSRELVGSEAPTLFAQAWTIGIEEKFYLVFPFFVMFFSRNDILLFLFIVLLIVTFICVDELELIRPDGYVSIGFGVLSAILYRRYKLFLYSHLSFTILLTSYFIDTFFKFDNSILLVSMSSSFFIVSLYKEKSIYSNFLSHDFLVYLGKLTYSIYLFHVLILFLVKYVLYFFGITNYLAIFCLGYLSCVIMCKFIYAYIEKPLIRKGKLIAKGFED